MKGSAIMVLGVAGVGKSTFGEHLASALRIRFLDIPEFVREHGLYSRYDRRLMSYIIDLRRVSIAVGAELGKEGAVIASIYAFKPRGIEVGLALVLRRKPTELIHILRERGYPLEKIRENVLAEFIDQPFYEAISKFGIERVVQLNVSGINLPNLARDVAGKILEGRVRTLNCEVDWMKTLEEEGDLGILLRFLEEADNI